jgi:hypothetical protein
MNYWSLVVAGLAVSTLARAQAPVDGKIDAKLLLGDFRIARSALEEGHSGIYRYTPKADLDAAFDGAAKQISGPMSPDQVRAHRRESAA